MTRSAYLTAAQVAERLGVSAKTVSRWAKAGHRRYDPDQIERLARELTVPTA